MVSVVFKYSDGGSRTIDVPSGQSLMEAAVRQGVDGIEADCGGVLSCATCQVWIDDSWLSKMSLPSRQESDMLEFAIDVGPNSRLCCDVNATEGFDGLVVEVPPSQR